MLKVNNKGFFLVETIVVVLIVLVLLITMYQQLVKVYSSYQENSAYNSIASIHAASNVRRYIEQSSLDALVTNLGTNQMVEITNFDLGNTSYFTNLKSMNNISKIYFSKYNINTVISNISSYGYNVTFEAYLKTLKITSNNPYPGRYRIIVVLTDNTYGNVDFTI